jgi:hypothetical protein
MTVYTLHKCQCIFHYVSATMRRGDHVCSIAQLGRGDGNSHKSPDLGTAIIGQVLTSVLRVFLLVMANRLQALDVMCLFLLSKVSIPSLVVQWSDTFRPGGWWNPYSSEFRQTTDGDAAQNTTLVFP